MSFSDYESRLSAGAINRMQHIYIDEHYPYCNQSHSFIAKIYLCL